MHTLTFRPVRNRISSTTARFVGSLIATVMLAVSAAIGNTLLRTAKSRGSSFSACASPYGSSAFSSAAPNPYFTASAPTMSASVASFRSTSAWPRRIPHCRW